MERVKNFGSGVISGVDEGFSANGRPANEPGRKLRGWRQHCQLLPASRQRPEKIRSCRHAISPGRGGSDQKCWRPAAERQAGDGGGGIRRKISSGHLLAGKAGNDADCQWRQGPAQRAAQVAVRAWLRRITGAGVRVAAQYSLHTADAAQLTGSHFFGQHGHRRQQG